MHITQKDYENLKWLLEDNKNGNFYSKGNYLCDTSLAFVLGLVKEYEEEMKLIKDYKNG